MFAEKIMKVTYVRILKYGTTQPIDIGDLVSIDPMDDAYIDYYSDNESGTMVIPSIRHAFDGILPVVGDIIVMRRDDANHDAWTFITDSSGVRIYDKYVNTSRSIDKQITANARRLKKIEK